MPVSKGVLTFE